MAVQLFFTKRRGLGFVNPNPKYSCRLADLGTVSTESALAIAKGGLDVVASPQDSTICSSLLAIRQFISSMVPVLYNTVNNAISSNKRQRELH